MFKALVALTTPLLPEDYLSLVDPLWSTTELRGRVVGVRRETERATSLRIKPGRAWAGHRAGQYVRIGVDIDGVRHWRTYSLSGAESDEHLTITVQALADGLVSRHLVDATPVGSIVRLEQATGDFVLPSPVPAKLLMITAGSGITPVMGMLRTLDGHPDAVVLHSAPTAADVLFDDELRALPGVTVRATRDEGRLDLADLDDLCPDWRDREAFVCGPTGLLDAAEEHWGEARSRLHLERFTPPARSTGGEGGTVTYGDTTVEVDGGASLLEAGEDAGVLLPSGCRMGICFSCVLPLRDGQVRDLRTGEVHGEPGDLVQTCITGATGTARLDLTR
ncbi:ferredoxin reductase [Pseudonocardia broussonetiae]|uniref:Ferredoxin reductase n=1 Tax=Pseudonocardia broussonetiae TaxID=2736640 RepID=A0A6M6JPZ1_9PSEU|nr:ferredoxin reductase [Pseudonocardia broussonetiae]QJY50104.1 ferredoxin reductase [Pseudonocardia broussonetiae]